MKKTLSAALIALMTLTSFPALASISTSAGVISNKTLAEAMLRRMPPGYTLEVLNAQPTLETDLSILIGRDYRRLNIFLNESYYMHCHFMMYKNEKAVKIINCQNTLVQPLSLNSEIPFSELGLAH